MRQWCLYWKGRQPLPLQLAGGPGPSAAAGGPGGGQQGRPPSDALGVARGSAAAAVSSGQEDGANTEMEDEADSAFVHQG